MADAASPPCGYDLRLECSSAMSVMPSSRAVTMEAPVPRGRLEMTTAADDDDDECAEIIAVALSEGDVWALTLYDRDAWCSSEAVLLLRIEPGPGRIASAPPLLQRISSLQRIQQE